jgi:hypothetical protein
VSDETITGRAPAARVFIDRMIRRLRWIAVGGLAAVTSGVLVLGIGGRLVMFLSRLLHPDAVGRFTENGNRIGEFTVEGTLALLIFGGLAGGLFAGVVWVIVKQWIPDNPFAVGLGAVAIGGFLLIEADNPDFLILRPPGLDLVLLLALIFLFGVVLHWFDKVFDRRLPARRGPVSTIVFLLLAVVGVAVAIPTFGNFFSSNFCGCAEPPVWTGIFLAVTAVVTASWWVLDLRGAQQPPAGLQLIGRVTTTATAVAGSVHLMAQVIAIV